MSDSAYRKFAEKVNQSMTGAPKVEGDFSRNFLEHLKLALTPEEAEVAACVAVEPEFLKAEQVAEKAGRPLADVEPILERLAGRGIIVGFAGVYVLPLQYNPLLLNLPSFWDQGPDKTCEADNLYQEYFIKEGFHHYYTTSAAGTPFRRTIPINESVAEGQQVLSYEEIDDFLDNASGGAMALLPCPCRSRTERLDIRECRDKHPLGACLLVGIMALHGVNVGWAKKVSREKAGQHVKEMRESGLVVMTNNAKEMKDGIICFCCGCCCSTTRGITRWDNPRSVARSNFVARVSDDCAACETCIDRCAFDAISMSDEGDRAQVDEDLCMGCGACTVTCPTEAIRLERLEREIVYESSAELTMKVAAENEAAGQKSAAS